MTAYLAGECKAKVYMMIDDIIVLAMTSMVWFSQFHDLAWFTLSQMHHANLLWWRITASQLLNCSDMLESVRKKSAFWFVHSHADR